MQFEEEIIQPGKCAALCTRQCQVARLFEIDKAGECNIRGSEDDNNRSQRI